MARKPSVLTQAQATYVEGVLDGKPRQQAAEDAGYAHANKATSMIERTAAVKHALAEARSELSTAAQMKRADVVVLLIEAIDMARIIGDPMGMIAGAREVGKMLGLYAPEKKEIELTARQTRLRSMYEGMSDEELLNVIEGEHVRLDS